MIIISGTLDGETKTVELRKSEYSMKCQLEKVALLGENTVPIAEAGRLSQSATCVYLQEDATGRKPDKLVIQLDPHIKITRERIPKSMDMMAELRLGGSTVKFKDRSNTMKLKETSDNVYTTGKKKLTFELPPKVALYAHYTGSVNKPTDLKLRLFVSPKDEEKWKQVELESEQLPRLYVTLYKPISYYKKDGYKSYYDLKRDCRLLSNCIFDVRTHNKNRK